MQKEFNILLRHRIPLLTKGVWALICVSLIILFLFWLFMLPASESHSSGEMKTAFYILAIPRWLKYLSAVALLSLVILVPLYLMRLRIPSSLSVFDDRFSIKNKRLNFTIPFSKIKKVFVNDLTNFRGELKFRLQVVIIYHKRKTLAFLLADYDDSDQLMESLANITPDKFGFYDKKLPAFDDDI